ncbi:MAG TPA: class I SAM-dependent methyltransferase [Stellaceae bacterium]|nr:class I SAM-dependent methyltransferase [Stellaceae bacterium]
MRLINALKAKWAIDREQLQVLRDIAAGVSNQAELINRKFDQLFVAHDNQTALLNDKFEKLFITQNNQTTLVNDKFEQLFVTQNNQTALVNDKFERLFVSQGNRTTQLNDKFDQLSAAQNNQTALIDRKFDRLIGKLGATGGTAADGGSSPRNFDEAMRQQPLLIADRTYNTNHPDYDARLVRNDPGRIFNRRAPCANFAFSQLVKGIDGDEVPNDVWNRILAEALIEAASVPGAAQVFERRAYIEKYMAELARKYHAHYVAGWVNLDDALFLYWLVRQLRPNKIVQCGACNGLSSSFMMLALAKNGPEGTLSVIDLPQIFDPADPEWTKEGAAYGVCIPEGKTTAWMVPDLYRDRLDIRNGDAKILLPPLIDELASVDFFYHDSDHTYAHMMFEFEQAKRKLGRGGVVVADDISWNSSLWDFADAYGVPSYNFNGAVGVAFF